MTRMRRVAVMALLISSPSAADTLGGFSSVATSYLVNPDRVCEPLEVAQGAATGVPTCARAATDTIAKLAFKPGAPQRGPAAQFAATAAGTELVVSRSGQVAFTWRTVDPISRVVDVYASQNGDRVAIAYATRRLGKQVVDVVAFLTAKTTKTTKMTTKMTGSIANPAPPETARTAAPVAADPAQAQRIKTARAAPKRQAMAAWKRVLDHEPDHSEALYQTARHAVGRRQRSDAIAALEALARSSREDAIEWLVEARFDPAFSSVRADARYRAAVGLDRKAKTDYEHVMGFGGSWEQVATCGEKPNVVLTTRRDRTFTLIVSVRCRGVRARQSFAGTWRLDPVGRSPGRAPDFDVARDAARDVARLVLVLPPAKGAEVSDNDEALCVFKPVGDEQALRCTVGQDLDFELLPTRR